MVTAAEYTERLEHLEDRLAAQKAQLRDLATMGAVITSIHEIDAVLSVVMDMAIRLVDGEVGLIMLHEKDDLRVKISWGVGEEFVRSLEYEDGLDLATYCFRTRETVVLSDLDIVSDQGISLQSVIASPINQSDNCLGVMIIINKSSGGNYTDEDRETLEMLLNFVAVAVDNSRMLKERLKQQKMRQEMAIAKQIQETLLPDGFQSIEGAEIGAEYYPAREVGGDFYDIIKIDNTKFLVVLGDVSNKGVPAAMVMSALSGILKAVIKNQPDIRVSDLACTLNNMMAHDIIKDREMFVTMFFCKFNLSEGLLTYCNAGHLPGLFWDDKKQSIVELPEGGPIVGQFPDIAYRQGERNMAGGDRLLLFTDGLTEAADTEGNMFGRERVEQVLTAEIGLDPKEFCHRVKEWIDRFAEGAPEDTHDDFTILQIKVG